MDFGNSDYLSESDVGDVKEYTAIVTVKESPEGVIYFQLDDDTVLYPQNYKDPFTGMKRIMCGITVPAGSNECYLTWMDYLVEGALLTGEADDDGMDVLDDWMTSVEDGFLTVHYSAWWGSGSVEHLLLLKSDDNPYELRLIHSMNGDEKLEKADALVYFDINDLIPDTEGTYKDLTIKWKDCASEDKSRVFRFRSRQ